MTRPGKTIILLGCALFFIPIAWDFDVRSCAYQDAVLFLCDASYFRGYSPNFFFHLLPVMEPGPLEEPGPQKANPR